MASRTAFPGTATDGTTHTAADDNKLPGGLIGYTKVSTNQGSITTTETDLTGLSQAVTVGASRAIRIVGQIQVSSTSSQDLIVMAIKEGATTLNQGRISVAAAAQAETLQADALVLAPSTGSHTYKLTLQRIGGTGTLTMACSGGDRDAMIMIFDDGPSF